MKENMKLALKWTLIILPIALVGGIFVGIYTYEHYDAAVKASILNQVGSYQYFLITCTAQSVVYSMITAFLGVLLSKGVNLWKEIRFQKAFVLKVLLLSTIAGLAMASDYFILGKMIPQVAADYEKGISPTYFAASLIYGGICEEVLLRLFFMSLVTLVIWKIAARKYSKEEIPTWVYVIANIVAALTFAAGHLPTSVSLFGGLNAIIVARCFLLNGGFGLLFGYFYREYGIQYAMESHFLIHFVSKLILLCVI